MSDAFLAPLVPRRKSGNEPFRNGNAPLGFDLLSFWQWSASDLVSNALRGRLAEFLVAQALGIAADGVRNEWDAYDLHISQDLTIEVKSAAYVQSWAQKALSVISFDIAPTRSWNPETNVLATEIRRQATVYVFAILAFKEKTQINPMDVSQWEFLVLPAAILNERVPAQKQIGLARLLKLNPVPCAFTELRGVIEQVAAKPTQLSY